MPPGTDSVAPFDAVKVRDGSRRSARHRQSGRRRAAGRRRLRSGASRCAAPASVCACHRHRCAACRRPRRASRCASRASAFCRCAKSASSSSPRGWWRATSRRRGGTVRLDERGRDLDGVLADDSADAIVAIGGTGSGRNDASVRTLARLGRVEVHGIALSPGETAAFGFVGAAAGAAAARPARCRARRLAADRAAHAGAPVRQQPSEHDARRPALARKIASTVGLAELVPVRCAPAHAEPLAAKYLPLAALAQPTAGSWCRPRAKAIPAGTPGHGEALAMSDPSQSSAGRASESARARVRRRRARSNSSKWSRPRKRARASRSISISSPLPAETVALADALAPRARRTTWPPRSTCRRSTAPTSTALRCAPPTRVGASDSTPRRLALNAEVIACGHAPVIEVAPGTATTIATGGVIPRGADAVVMVEHTDLVEDGAPAIESAPRRRARAIRLLCRLRHRARRDRAAARHAHRLARDRHAGGLRHRRGRRWCGGRASRCSRPATSWSRPASRSSRPASTTATARSSRPRSPRRAASRCRSAPSPTTSTRSSSRARGARALRHGGALRRHLEGRRRSLAPRCVAAGQARHPGARRRAQARQAAVPRASSTASRSWCCRAFRPRRSSPSTLSWRR